MTAEEAPEKPNNVLLAAAADHCGSMADEAIEPCKEPCEVGAETCATKNMPPCCVVDKVGHEGPDEIPIGFMVAVPGLEDVIVFVCTPLKPVEDYEVPITKGGTTDGEAAISDETYVSVKPLNCEGTSLTSRLAS